MGIDCPRFCGVTIKRWRADRRHIAEAEPNAIAGGSLETKAQSTISRPDAFFANSNRCRMDEMCLLQRIPLLLDDRRSKGAWSR